MNRIADADTVPARPSFEAFAAGCATRLMRAAYLLCGDHQTAEDLLQITMMRTARRWTAARAAPEAYARRVLVNAARDQARRGLRRVDEVLVHEDYPSRPGGLGTGDHSERIAERDAVLRALAALPQRQREVIVLRFYADLSVADAAAAIGASEGTVMSYTSRALTRMRELMADRDPIGEPAVEGEVSRGHR